MERPVGYTCKQYKHKSFRRGQGKEQCLFVWYKSVFSSGAAADLPSAPTKYPHSRGEFQEGLGECFGRSKDVPLCPVYMWVVCELSNSSRASCPNRGWSCLWSKDWTWDSLGAYWCKYWIILSFLFFLQFPSQMGSVLSNPLLLHYMNCVKDESIYLRLYYWMGQMLQEGRNFSIILWGRELKDVWGFSFFSVVILCYSDLQW